MRFKPYECDFGFKYNGVSYDFAHVNSLSVEDNERTRITRGANANNKLGLVYKEGIKEPKMWTVQIMDTSLEIKELLDVIYKNRERVDVYCVSRIDGSSKIAKNAILSQEPQQLLIDETPDSMNVDLIFETFDAGEVYKE
jgi:hypothetical protein